MNMNLRSLFREVLPYDTFNDHVVTANLELKEQRKCIMFSFGNTGVCGSGTPISKFCNKCRRHFRRLQRITTDKATPKFEGTVFGNVAEIDENHFGKKQNKYKESI